MVPMHCPMLDAITEDTWASAGERGEKDQPEVSSPADF